MFEFINAEKANRLVFLFGHFYDDFRISLEEGEVLYKEGTPGEHIYMIQSGEIGLFKKGEEDYFHLNDKSNGVLGLSTLFRVSDHTHTAITRSPSIIFKTPVAEFRKLLKNNIQLYGDVLMPLLQDVSYYEKRIHTGFNN